MAIKRISLSSFVLLTLMYFSCSNRFESICYDLDQFAIKIPSENTPVIDTIFEAITFNKIHSSKLRGINGTIGFKLEKIILRDSNNLNFSRDMVEALLEENRGTKIFEYDFVYYPSYSYNYVISGYSVPSDHLYFTNLDLYVLYSPKLLTIKVSIIDTIYNYNILNYIVNSFEEGPCR